VSDSKAESEAMRKRPGVTLVEVLVTIFIMGIGMLALLTLFPVGAISMARALVNDRAAQAANNADAIATIQDIRHDPFVISDTLFPNDAFTNPFGTMLSTSAPGSSNGVFVDAWGYLVDATETVGSPAPSLNRIRRRSISLRNAPAHAGTALTITECGRWCSLTDDLYWNTPNNGIADVTSTGTPRRGLAYTWSWLLRRPRAFDPTAVEMSVIVYRGRSAATSTGETTYTATGTVGTNAVTVTYAAGSPPSVRTGRWILDVTPNNVTAATATLNGAVPGYCYRVVDYTDVPATSQMQLELEVPLKQTVQAVVLLEDVVEVIDKGSGWLP
jgi:prepilin-type N-terminal cleavage/methylation domain-containing protein